jgi:hypothetical protein
MADLGGKRSHLKSTVGRKTTQMFLTMPVFIFCVLVLGGQQRLSANNVPYASQS